MTGCPGHRRWAGRGYLVGAAPYKIVGGTLTSALHKYLKSIILTGAWQGHCLFSGVLHFNFVSSILLPGLITLKFGVSILSTHNTRQMKHNYIFEL